MLLTEATVLVRRLADLAVAGDLEGWAAGRAELDALDPVTGAAAP